MKGIGVQDSSPHTPMKLIYNADEMKRSHILHLDNQEEPIEI